MLSVWNCFIQILPSLGEWHAPHGTDAATPYLYCGQTQISTPGRGVLIRILVWELHLSRKAKAARPFVTRLLPFGRFATNGRGRWQCTARQSPCRGTRPFPEPQLREWWNRKASTPRSSTGQDACPIPAPASQNPKPPARQSAGPAGASALRPRRRRGLRLLPAKIAAALSVLGAIPSLRLLPSRAPPRSGHQSCRYAGRPSHEPSS